jgi:hypothetical protein
MDPKGGLLKLVLLGVAAVAAYTYVGPLGLILIGVVLYMAA